jgi:hypothetical protein
VPGLVVKATTGLVSSASRPFSLFVGGTDIIAPTGSTVYAVPLESIRLSETGTDRVTMLTIDFDDPARAFSIPERARVLFVDNAAGETLFGGFVAGRSVVPAYGGAGRRSIVTAADGGSVLDRRYVARHFFPSGLPDRAIVQQLVGMHAGDLISALSTTVAQTQATMPEILVEKATLRQAIEQVAAAATFGGSTQRRVFVDPTFRLHYFTATILTAPYIVTDNPTLGSHRAVDAFRYEEDDARIINAVYVEGANEVGSGWEYDHASIDRYGLGEGPLQVSDSDTADKRAAYAAAFLADAAYPVPRGSFRTNTTGWHGGQLVTVTNAAAGLAARTFEVSQVDTVFLDGSGKRTQQVHFGRAPKSGATALLPAGRLRPPSDPRRDAATPLTPFPGLRPR